MKIKKGFTLLELVIYLGLMSVLLVVMTQIFVSVLDVRSETEALSSVEQDGNYLVSRLAYDISRSTNIITPAGVGGQGNTLQLVIGGINYTYTQNGSNLELTDNTGTYQLNGFNSDIAAATLNFKRISVSPSTPSTEDTIQFTFTINSKNKGRNGTVESKIYQSTAAIRDN